MSFLYSLFGGTAVHRYYGEQALTKYNEAAIVNKESFPAAEALESAERVEYYETECFYFFYSNAHILICRYAQEDYAKQADALAETYQFQQEAIVDHDGTCEPAAKIDGYTFRMLAVDSSYYKNAYFPKNVWLVGQNDKRREIVYLSFEDDDLDYIPSLEEFIKTDCGWQHIR